MRADIDAGINPAVEGERIRETTTFASFTLKYDRPAGIDQGTVVEYKRLGHMLRVAQAIQA